MGRGKVFHDAGYTYTDRYSGRQVRQLTNFLGHSYGLYFTDERWYNNNRSMIFTADRDNASNFFSCDLDTGIVTQLTDSQSTAHLRGTLCPANNCFYYWPGDKVMELNLATLEERVIYTVPPTMINRTSGSITADGKYVILLIQEKVEAKGVSFSYSQFEALFHARPFSQIMRIEIATGKAEVIHEDRCYMGHLNTSPRRPELLTFCHEGPWSWVDQRMWGLDILTGKCWKLRPQNDENLAIGHEYWFADGEHVGYHGRPREGHGRHLYGFCRWDDTEHVEVEFPFFSAHFHSLDRSLIVGDGNPSFAAEGKPFIQLFKWNGEKYVGPKILAFHRSSFCDQHAHPHPAISPDGKYVFYNSDLTGYSNVYMVEIGDFDSLPDADQHTVVANLS